LASVSSFSNEKNFLDLLQQGFESRNDPINNISFVRRTHLPKRRSSNWTAGSDLDNTEDSIAPTSDLDTSIPELNECSLDSESFLELLTQRPESPEPKKRKAQDEPPAKRMKTAPALPIDAPVEHDENPLHQPDKASRNEASRTMKPPRRRPREKREDQVDKFWHNSATVYVTPFLENTSMYPKEAIDSFCKMPWGGLKYAFSPNKYLLWDDSMTSEDIQKCLLTVCVLPNTIIWLPFNLPLCEKALQAIFRLSFSNSFALVAFCPFFENSTLLRSILANAQHASIVLSEPTNFCPIKTVLIFFQCPTGPDITVENTPLGCFSLASDVLSQFKILENCSLIAPRKFSPDGDITEKIEHLLQKADDLESNRQAQNFPCPKFDTLQVNNFIRKPFPFDITSNGPHFYPCSAIRKFYPKKLLTFPKKKRSMSYKEYNELCEDDTKITGHAITDSNLMFCTQCGKYGHLPEICWMNVRSTQQLGLTTPQDIALNSFLLSFPQAHSLPRLSPDDDKVKFVTDLQEKLEIRAGYFSKSWEIFAKTRRVSVDLVRPGFSQMRQGLAFWYAISCPTYVLQWVAFGIPVFWLFARPPPFEVRPHKTNSKPQDSSPTTLESIAKFLDLHFILPVPRKYIHCVAPLFDRESSGSMRSIHDLRLINRYIMKISFSLFTAFNFCNLSAEGSVFIVTDFSKCWFQMRHLVQDMMYFAFRTIEQGHYKYWLPTGKTFGESDVPFAITHLVSYITALFSLFTLCAFWIDDGIIHVGNVNEGNWVQIASRIRVFAAFIFSALCLIVNDKCDFQPSIEKPWVGLWNTASKPYIKAEKIRVLGNILINICESRTISQGQALRLHGKLASLGIALDDSFQLKILSSLLKSVTHILDIEAFPKSASLPISKQFIPWALEVLNILINSLLPYDSTHDLEKLKQIFIACDASNIGGGLVIEYNKQILFETSRPLPQSHMETASNQLLSASSTDNERFVFESLALQDARKFLDVTFPDEKLFLNILTDSLPLAIQLTSLKLRTLRVSFELKRIYDFLRDWGMPYKIMFHKRDKYLASLADANTRYFVPTLLPEQALLFTKLTQAAAFRYLHTTDAVLNPIIYFNDSVNEIIPLNLSPTLYSKIFHNINLYCTSKYIFCPKLSHMQPVLLKRFKILFEFSTSSFIETGFSFKTLPYLLCECFDVPTTRSAAPKTPASQAAWMDSLTTHVQKHQARIQRLVDSPESFDIQSWEDLATRPVTLSKREI